VPEPGPDSTPLWLGDGSSALFGFLHAPRGVRSRSSAVVLVPPLGYEAICAHGALRRAAERFAELGFFVLRYDHPGTGDSAGSDRDPRRVESWVAGVARAIDGVRAASGCDSVALVGLRMGALLALTAAERRHDVTCLVLWAPPATGSSYVRELRALGGFGTARATSSDVCEQAAGFAFSAETLDDISSIDPSRVELSKQTRVLLIPRDDVAAARPPKLADDLVVQTRALPGYAEAMRDPHESGVPDALLDGIAGFIAAALPELGVGPGRREFAAESEVSLRASATASQPIVEQAVRFGPGERLFGIVTLPSTATPGPCVLWLNAGAIHHVGMNRNYVSFARAWAERGVTSLRFDGSGLGDSGTLDDGVKAALYSREIVADVRAAMDFMQARYQPSKFVLAGLCAGAYAAFHTAVADERVATAVMINPQTFDYRPGDPLSIQRRSSFRAARWYSRSARRPESWRKALRGQVNLFRVAGVFGERIATELRSRLTSFRTPKQKPCTLAQAFEALSDRGTRVLLVYSADDPGLDHLRHELGPALAALCTSPRFAFEVIDGADHTFTPLHCQEVLSECLATYLVRWHGAAERRRTEKAEPPGFPLGPRRVFANVRRAAKHALASTLPRSWLVMHGPRGKRRIALTFDDGPTELTYAYLDVLDHYHTAATFFLVGRACEQWPAQAAEVARRGHELGSHGYTHRTFPELGSRALLGELERTDELLKLRPNGRRWVRPPHGAVTPRSLFDCARAGFSTVLWSYDSGDCRTGSAHELSLGFERDPPRAGDIVLLHEDNHHTLQALPTLIESLLRSGYELVTVADLLRDPHPQPRTLATRFSMI